eukprot:TRINITY_DN6162_c0_g1_i2.p1 TRINITY_DN6162_c0_g1~~TRINITY_DN6162_c0_g1_i2.p1  ORF type:complete len:735 (-),score=162.11 TRINITY_DN6162_c0_g1_i2:28-2232(-)
MGETALPSWLKVGSKCRWWSESQKTHHPIVITSVDVVKRRVVAHFVADHSVWKTVPFSHVGSNGPLRPPEDIAGGAGKSKDQQDGTATPPWYEQLNAAESRVEAMEDIKRKEEDHEATKERRRYLWQQEQQRRADEERKQRDEERRAREAAAEVERLRILDKLKREREEEQQRQFECMLMGREEEVSSRVNEIWRKSERAARRQQEEEERERFEEEQRVLRQRLQEEMASRPRIAFGVRQTRQEPAKVSIPQQSERVHSEPHSIPSPEPHRFDEGDRFEHEAERHESEPADAWNDSWNDSWQAESEQMPPQARPPQQQQVPAPQQPVPSQQTPGADFMHLLPGLPPLPPVRPPPPRQAPAEVTARDWYAMQVRVVYQKHNPEKLPDVPSLMDKYAGSEEEMYELICEKYRVQPVPPPANLKRPPATSVESKPKAVGYARKAGAPVPPRSNSKDQRTPSASALMARFQNLVGDLGDEHSDGEEWPAEQPPREQAERASGSYQRRQSSRSPRLHDGDRHGEQSRAAASRGSRAGGNGASLSRGTAAAPIGGRVRPSSSDGGYSGSGDAYSNRHPATSSSDLGYPRGSDRRNGQREDASEQDGAYSRYSDRSDDRYDDRSRVDRSDAGRRGDDRGYDRRSFKPEQDTRDYGRGARPARSDLPIGARLGTERDRDQRSRGAPRQSSRSRSHGRQGGASSRGYPPRSDDQGYGDNSYGSQSGSRGHSGRYDGYSRSDRR